MTQSSNYRVGPGRTPKPLKALLFTLFFISLFAAFFERAMPRFFDLESPDQLLGLSTVGIGRLYLWQFFTYLFIQPVTQGISFSFLISLAFSLYLFWVMGASIMEKRGTAGFFTFFFATGLFVGLIVFGLQTLAGSTVAFAGSTSVLYATLMAWVMLYPGTQLLLLMALPIKAKWLVLSILGANLLIDLSTGQWLNALAYLSGALFGYLYPLLFWKCRGPFLALHPFEDRVLKILGGPEKEAPLMQNSRAKIYDFKTGRAILNDEEFLDEMLSKISLHGKSSLTWKERFRLKRISKRKKKERS